MHSTSNYFVFWKNYACLDVQNMTLKRDGFDENSWLFLPEPVGPKHLRCLQNCFLISTPHKSNLRTDLPIALADFSDLAKFFRKVIEGKASVGALQLAFLHLRHITQFPRQLQFNEESAMFAKQFTGREPKTGLQGFLKKDAQPFQKINPYIEALESLESWLGRESHQ